MSTSFKNPVAADPSALRASLNRRRLLTALPLLAAALAAPRLVRAAPWRLTCTLSRRQPPSRFWLVEA